jgi:hypothetical protein
MRQKYQNKKFKFYIEEYKGNIDYLIEGSIINIKKNENKGILKLKFVSDRHIFYKPPLLRKINSMIKEFRIHLFNKFIYIQISTCPIRKKFIKTKRMAKYTLLDAKSHELSFGAAIKDPGVGGIKLVYSKSKEYSLTGETKKVIFLKPYKEIWEPRGRKYCKRDEWGNTMSPLSNVWLELYEDYNNYKKEIEKVGFIQHQRVTDVRLIKRLNSKSAIFTIAEANDNLTTHLGIKISIWVNNHIIIPIKEIIINIKKSK